MKLFAKPCDKPTSLFNTMKILRIIVIGSVTFTLTGCSYVQGWFPDKERDYQYTAEIPLINYPAELRKNQPASGSSLDAAAETPSSLTSTESTETNANTENAEQPLAETVSPDKPPEAQPVPSPETQVTPASESDERDTVSSVEIIKYDDGESRLRLGSGLSKSWRVVNKALSRKTIEVTARNFDQAQIAIQYDPDEKIPKDESFMDEIGFLFRGISVNDRQFVLKLEEHGEKTDVIVLNEEHLPMLNDEAALRLLKVLADTIKADLADKGNADKPAN
jgi:outer membrane protein assembly factor BamC